MLVGNEFIDEARLLRRARAVGSPLHFVLTSQGLDSQRLVRWIDAMVAAAPATIHWRLSIKLHPVYDQDSGDFSTLQDDKRIRIIGGSELPNVFDLLSDADLHLSIASACHFDAAALGIRSVVIPLAGHESVLYAVDGTQIVLARDPEDVWEIIGYPDTSVMERAHRFSEPNFIANMQKLVCCLTRSELRDRPLHCNVGAR